MVRKKSENLTSSQGTFESLKEVRKKGNFKSTHLFLSLYFCCSLNIFNSFVHFTDMNHVVLVDCCSLHWTTRSYVKELWIRAPYTWLAESLNKWVERMAVREVLSALGKFDIFREKSGTLKILWLWQYRLHFAFSFFINSEFTQQDGGKKRTAKRLCVTNVMGLLLAFYVVILT